METESIQLLLNNLVSLIVTGLAIVTTFYIKVALKKFGEKTDAETQSSLQDVIGNCVAQGVSYAEQWAKKLQLEMGKDKKVAGNDKLIKAIEYTLNDLRKHGITDFSEKEIKDKAESFLGIATLNINSIPQGTGPILEGEDNEQNPYLPSN